MTLKTFTIIPTALLVLSLVGCGSSDSDNDLGSGNDPTGDNPVSVVTVDSAGSDANGQAATTTPFFNDQAGFKFADSLGGMLSRLFSSGFGFASGISGGSESGGSEPAGPVLLSKRQILASASLAETCDGGGNLSVNHTTDDATGDTTALEITFNNCQEEGQTTNGSISVSGSALAEDAQSGTASIVIDNFSVTGTDPVSMNGQINAVTSIAGDEIAMSVSGSDITITADNETITFSNYSLTVVGNDRTGEGSMEASLTVTSSIDGTVNMLIDPALYSPDDSTDYPVSGTITMTHSDGSSLTIDADTGNAATFSYTINENGAVTTHTGNWADTNFDL